MNTLYKKYSDRWIILLIGLFIFAGLLARDLLGLQINKYIFLILILIPILTAQIGSVIVFSFFVIPLYVGLPGNYITVFIFIRIIYEIVKKNISINTTGFLLSLIIGAYLFIQNSIMGYIGIYNIMASFDFVILFILLGATKQYKITKQAIIAFSLGNCILGIIMLGSTLRFFSFSELMNSSTRMGNTGLLVGKTNGNMLTTIDPNFYAMNVIACISSACLLLSFQLSKTERFVLIFSIFGCAICCVIGLSRTFIIILCVWTVLYLASHRNIKTKIIFTLVGCFIIFAFAYFVPVIVDGFQSRFNADDFTGGNGRIELVIKYFNLWFSNSITLLFGIGLFNCHTHCSPLLYLYGLGIVGFLPLVVWFICVWNMCKRKSKYKLRQCVPFIVTFIAFSTIPAAGSINYTLPILITMLAASIENDNGERNEQQSRWKYLKA